MDIQDTLLASFLFGGHVLSGVAGIVLLHRFFRFLPRRVLVSLALLIVPAGLGYVTLFDLAFSGRFLPAAIPLALSIVLLIIFAALVRPTFKTLPRRALPLVLLLLPLAWGHFFTIFFAHSCFLGACV